MCHEYPTGCVSTFAVLRYRLSTASAYSIYELYSQDWCEDISAPPMDESHEYSKPRLDDWTVEDVVRWSLTTTLSPEVANWLRQQEVTGQVLRSLDEAELAAMGLEPFGRRRQLLLCREDVLAEEAKEVKEKKADFRCEIYELTRQETRSIEDKSQHSQHSTKVAKAIDFAASLPTPARALCKRKLKEDATLCQAQELLQVPEETPAEISPARAVAETAQLIKECGDMEVRKPVSKTLYGREPLTGRPESHPIHPGIRCASHTLSRCFHQCLPGFNRPHGYSPVQQPQWVPRNLGICSGRAVSWMPPRWVQSPLTAPSTRTISWMPVPIKAMHSWTGCHTPLRPRLGLGVPTSGQVLSQGALRTVTRGPAATFLCPPLRTPCITLPPRVIGYSVTVRPRPRPNF